MSDEERGWAAAGETCSGEDLLVVAYLGHTAIAGWVNRLRRDATTSPVAQSGANDDLPNRLSAYAVTATTPLPTIS